MRFDCAEPEFPGAFMEFSDAWSVRERRTMFLVQGDDFFAMLRRKVTALNLPALEGETLTRPDQLTTEGIEGLDGRLWDWLRGVIALVALHLGELGEEVQRRQLSISATKPES